tara:strand:- start:6752 stop:7624 length:873 start_codon:yes stop_codon:yes gene_type:complete
MDSNTITALSMVLNHESTDEVIRLRKENNELKSKLNRIESNMKRLTECIGNCELIMEIVSERDDDVMNNVPFETMLDVSLREDNDFELSDDERRQLLIDYNNNKDLITIDNFDHGLEAPIMGQIIYPITRCLTSKPETFEYILKHINPLRQQYGSRRTFPLLPDYKMYVNMYDFTCEDGFLELFMEHDLEHQSTFKENQKLGLKEELETGISHRLDMFLSKLKEWKLNDCIDELKPRLYNFDTQKEITIHEYVKYYLEIKQLALTEHQYEYQPCSLFRSNLDEYLRENNL